MVDKDRADILSKGAQEFIDKRHQALLSGDLKGGYGFGGSDTSRTSRTPNSNGRTKGFHLDAEAYLLKDKLPKGFDPINKLYDPQEISQYGELVACKEDDALLTQFHQMLWVNYLSLSWTAATAYFVGNTTSNNTYNATYFDGSIPIYSMMAPFRCDYWCGPGFGNATQILGTGIQIGANNQAVVVNDSKLIVPYLSGYSGANNLVFGVSQFSSSIIYTSGANNNVQSFYCGRAFTNLSGANVTVAEMGLYCQHNNVANLSYWCMARDLVDPTVEIANNKAAYFQYRFSISV